MTQQIVRGGIRMRKEDVPAMQAARAARLEAAAYTGEFGLRVAIRTRYQKFVAGQGYYLVGAIILGAVLIYLQGVN